MERKVVARNNLPIYYYTNNSLHKFCITICIKAGNLYDDKEELGIAHFLEHIIFRNINRALDDKMKQRLDSIGAYFNGCTFNELIEIKIVAAKQHFKECASIISKVFETIDVSKENIDIERKRIKSEIREDDEKSSIDYIGRKIAWKGTNLTRSIAGSNKILDTIDGDRLQSYAKEVFSPNNVFVYVTGAASKEDIAVLSEYVGAYELNVDSAIKDNMAPIPKNFFNRDIAIKVKKSDYCEVRYSFDIDSKECKNEYLALIYEILFNGECSKVYDELSEKTGMVYSYDSSIDMYNNIGTINFSYEVKYKQLKKSIEKIMQILKNLKNGLEDELNYVLPSYIDNAEMILDDPERLAWIMSYEAHILEGGFKSISERKKIYENITKEQVVKAMKSIFKPENLVLNINVKKKYKDKIEVENIRKLIREYL